MKLLRNSIEGLEMVLSNDIPPSSIIIVTGPHGSFKTSFVYTFISNNISKTGEFGLYISLEESGNSCIANLRSIGVKPNPRLEIFDYQDIRDEYERIEGGIENLKILEGIEEIIKFYKKREGDSFTCMALDSLSALYSLMPQTDMRRKMYQFFNMFRRYGLTTFLILESSVNPSQETYYGEYFLADGVIKLDRLEAGDDVYTYIQVEKMRGMNHSRKKYQLNVGVKGLVIKGVEYV